MNALILLAIVARSPSSGTRAGDPITASRDGRIIPGVVYRSDARGGS
jgi:hypothetical protein